MTTINLNEFIEKVKDYQTSIYGLENNYLKTLAQRDVWENLREISEQTTKDVILKFLNAWKCRISYKFTPSLTRILRESSELFSRLSAYTLQDVSLRFILDDEDVKKAFRNIASVKFGNRTVGATATSKILHLINPNFLMMSDKAIRYGYGCSDNDIGYVNFMCRMKLLSDNLVNEYSKVRNVDRKNVFSNLKSECNSRATTIPKLLDEYNWIKFNL